MWNVRAVSVEQLLLSYALQLTKAEITLVLKILTQFWMNKSVRGQAGTPSKKNNTERGRLLITVKEDNNMENLIQKGQNNFFLHDILDKTET